MSVEAYLERLREKHKELSRMVEDEEKHYARDEVRLKEMKLRKLRLKEEITKLEHQK